MKERRGENGREAGMKKALRFLMIATLIGSLAGCATTGYRGTVPEYHPGHPGHEVH